MSSQFAFPNYNDGQRTNANSDSAALNKWLKGKIGEGYTTHSFRHSMRDRLRVVECPSDVIDQIGGWLTPGVGSSYGLGHMVAKQQSITSGPKHDVHPVVRRHLSSALFILAALMMHSLVLRIQR